MVFVKGIIGEEEKTEVLQKIAEEIENLKKNSPFNLGSGEIIVNSIDDEDWKNEWKKYYKPIVTKSVTVVPVWIKYNKISDKEKILWINPGMAFGTGEHETTKMCLDLLGEIDVSGKTVIDVGTGSGILGIASILSDAKSAKATSTCLQLKESWPTWLNMVFHPSSWAQPARATLFLLDRE